MCQPTDAPPYPTPEPGTGSMVHGPEGHRCYHCDRSERHAQDCPWNIDADPTAAEDARINARTPRDDRNEPEE